MPYRDWNRDDPIADAEDYCCESDPQALRCDECGEEMDGEYYLIDDVKYCSYCMRSLFRRRID